MKSRPACESFVPLVLYITSGKYTVHTQYTHSTHTVHTQYTHSTRVGGKHIYVGDDNGDHSSLTVGVGGGYRQSFASPYLGGRGRGT